jgi:hypothetical protein
VREQPNFREDPRSAVFQAVYLEAMERGATERDARATAEDVCDRLRIPDSQTGTGDHALTDGAPGFYDLRSEQDYLYPNGKHKCKLVSGANAPKRVPLRRDPKKIDTIVIHQTACEFGISAQAIKLAGGDRDLAKARRALDVACHALAFRAGFFVAAHPLLDYVYHGNRLNDRSLGIEIEGRYCGLMDDPSTLPREDLDTTYGGPPTELTETTIATSCAALTWLVEEASEQGIDIRYIMAHRQSSNDRRSDPGEEIWKEVVLGFAVNILGLETMPHNTWREGYSIPRQWDPNGKANY